MLHLLNPNPLNLALRLLCSATTTARIALPRSATPTATCFSIATPSSRPSNCCKRFSALMNTNPTSASLSPPVTGVQRVIGCSCGCLMRCVCVCIPSGARLTHSHHNQFDYVLQSMTLWRYILHNMYKLWTLAQEDLLDPENRYRLQDTGQG